LEKVNKDLQVVTVELFSADDKLAGITSALNTAQNAFIEAKEAKKNDGVDLEALYAAAQAKQAQAEKAAKER